MASYGDQFIRLMQSLEIRCAKFSFHVNKSVDYSRIFPLVPKDAERHWDVNLILFNIPDLYLMHFQTRKGLFGMIVQGILVRSSFLILFAIDLHLVTLACRFGPSERGASSTD